MTPSLRHLRLNRRGTFERLSLGSDFERFDFIEDRFLERLSPCCYGLILR